MNTDRESAYYAAYGATSEDDALEHEYDNGIKVILEESIPGKQVSILPILYYAAHRATSVDDALEHEYGNVCHFRRVCTQ